MVKKMGAIGIFFIFTSRHMKHWAMIEKGLWDNSYFHWRVGYVSEWKPLLVLTLETSTTVSKLLHQSSTHRFHWFVLPPYPNSWEGRGALAKKNKMKVGLS
jgi:hypothetical protein